jgi:crotonobetainyl-CoA:carnitine CoA-transferase CaiB-like acyl-CoA transferase
MIRPLDGVKIVDLSNMLMAPYATQILGDMGADVIKVESPEGDPIRDIGPTRSPRMGAIFLHANRSKRSLVLNLKQSAGRCVLLKLIKNADVLIFNRRPKSMQRLGLSYETVSQINPRIIYAGMFGYGEDGPYAGKPAFDDLIQGAAAIPWLSHKADGGEPAYVPTAIVDRGVALWAVGQITAALYHQSRTGQGQQIDMPMFEMMASFVLADHLTGHTFEPPLGPPGYARMIAPNRKPYRTQDGYICVLIYTDRHWRDFFKLFGQEETVENDPRFASMTTRSENIESIYDELAELFTAHSSQHWLQLLDEADIPAMPLHSLESLIDDPHLQATGFFSINEHPSEGTLREINVPSRWSQSQPAPTRHAPQLGEHSTEILTEAGYSEKEIERLLADQICGQYE